MLMVHDLAFARSVPQKVNIRDTFHFLLVPDRWTRLLKLPMTSSLRGYATSVIRRCLRQYVLDFPSSSLPGWRVTLMWVLKLVTEWCRIWAKTWQSVANLMLAYLSPATFGNHELRQCLTSFFPVYSYSSVTNQKNIMGVSLLVFFISRAKCLCFTFLDLPPRVLRNEETASWLGRGWGDNNAHASC